MEEQKKMIDLPWSIGDNDIQSKGIKAWSDRQQRESQMLSSSSARKAYSDMLFARYIADQISEATEYNAFYDTMTTYELNLLA
tara:strand:+ start:237 stop:485 length:249 start_codon:yes stop_codon:yes gene_type:complete